MKYVIFSFAYLHCYTGSSSSLLSVIFCTIVTLEVVTAQVMSLPSDIVTQVKMMSLEFWLLVIGFQV